MSARSIDRGASNTAFSNALPCSGKRDRIEPGQVFIERVAGSMSERARGPPATPPRKLQLQYIVDSPEPPEEWSKAPRRAEARECPAGRPSSSAEEEGHAKPSSPSKARSCGSGIVRLDEVLAGLPHHLQDAVPEEFARDNRVMMKKRRARKYKVAVPSKFCHLCARKEPKQFLACSNIKSSVCLKIVCSACFVENQWDFNAAMSAQAQWTCP
eukprot:CAMPEP_0198325724 /NCGR_PEP_ID=MMETSP1450-20131203/13401_1 /TAXON_ID=753684 ORGANISM="Madagascaria erythrocladiodes, Strain CCMP3234" /NCGR_SAMPLE_ID=MMETSP1450 /ASSEMBLY_ACC=CAM_ASM_001115 /LENGTH=212 /DNA_ID=CAMNT_0044029639 /DNA_START=373 /DNA_END=1011 /DNA_ORIENTATION=+